jgi:hypothetical protein
MTNPPLSFETMAVELICVNSCYPLMFIIPCDHIMLSSYAIITYYRLKK